jgi:hypothetical protein
LLHRGGARKSHCATASSAASVYAQRPCLKFKMGASESLPTSKPAPCGVAYSWWVPHPYRIALGVWNERFHPQSQRYRAACQRLS